MPWNARDAFVIVSRSTVPPNSLRRRKPMRNTIRPAGRLAGLSSAVPLAALPGAALASTREAPSVPVLPAGVTVQAIDGETCRAPSLPSTCTHNYYSRNGYTYLTADPGSGPFLDWDSPSVFTVEAISGQ